MKTPVQTLSLLGLLLSCPGGYSAEEIAEVPPVEVRLLEGRELSGERAEGRWIGEPPGWRALSGSRLPVPDLREIGALTVGEELLWFGPRHDHFFCDTETVLGVTVSRQFVSIGFRTVLHPNSADLAEVIAAERLRHSTAKETPERLPLLGCYEWGRNFATRGIWGELAFIKYNFRNCVCQRFWVPLLKNNTRYSFFIKLPYWWEINTYLWYSSHHIFI